MSLKTIAVLTFFILVAIGTGIYVSSQNRIEESATMAVTPTATLPNTRETPAVLPESNATPDRTLVTHGPATALLVDVPESQLDHEALEGFLGARHIGAYRIVQIDSDSLRTKIRESAVIPGFEIQLLSSDPIKLVSRDAEEHSSGWKTGIGTWIGVVEGDETSRASFVVGTDGSVNGVIRALKTGRIKIEPIKGTPNHIVWRLGADFEKKID